MNSITPSSNTLHAFDKKQLLSLKTRAMRSGTWFKSLQRIDRVLFDLVIKVVDNIRSTKLAKSIRTLVEKLENATKSGFSHKLREIGPQLAKQISLVAQKMGNLASSEWALDSSFAFFLAVMHVNNPFKQQSG